MVDGDVGESIPALTPHAVSVSLPTWRSNVGYEEGETWVVSKMQTGYPRFFINKTIEAFSQDLLECYGHPGERTMLFPTPACASRCVAFFNQQAPHCAVRTVHLVSNVKKEITDVKYVSPRISAIIFAGEHWSVAKAFWQHTGEGVSSRRAEFCHELFREGLLVEKKDETPKFSKGPKRYRKSLGQDSIPVSLNGSQDNTQDSTQFIEERFGRNLELKFAEKAKLAIKRRIAGSLTADVALDDALELDQDQIRKRDVAGFSEDDIYLYPCGMNAIYNAHRTTLVARGSEKSIMYGFSYVDTLKVLEKFGPGCIFYGFGEGDDLNDLESRLEKGDRFLCLMCEFPGNPLLKTPDLVRIRALADKYKFAVIVDETIGNFLNVHVLPFADVVVSSLTKVFSGDSNVMGGSAILNPRGQFYSQLKEAWGQEYEDNYWAEDAIFMERNSRDFVSRIDRINKNAEAICEVLQQDSRVKQVMYPKYNATRPFYDQCRTPNGGYGGLLSVTFHEREHAITFFDSLDTAKGPSLGTNFTLSSPFVILAHYNELEWAESYGVERGLIRFSVGLEDTEALVNVYRNALAAIDSKAG